MNNRKRFRLEIFPLNTFHVNNSAKQSFTKSESRCICKDVYRDFYLRDCRIHEITLYKKHALAE